MPKFSIIVPVYNVEEYLKECVQSVIHQTFTDWELILVDDGSSDNSYQICCDFSHEDDRIKVIHQENGGASKARNNGIKHFVGDYIIFLDSDDFYNDADALSILNNKINISKSDVVIFGCTDFNMITGETNISRTGYNLELINRNIYNDTMHYLLSNKLIPGGPTIFCIRRSVLIDNNIYFKESIQDEDYDFVLSVFSNCNSISAIDNPFYSYRKGRAESVTGASNIKMIYGIEYTVNKWIPLGEKIENEIIRTDFLNYIAFIYSTGFVICGRLNSQDRKDALKIMNKYKYVLKYAYWKKMIITKYAIKVLGTNLFSMMAAKYFDRTHI